MLLRRRIGLVVLVALLNVGPALAAQPPVYFPEPFDWQRRPPAQVGMDAALLDEALRYAATVDNPAPRDQAQALAQSFGAKEPYFGGLLGATRPRPAINGMIVRRGHVVAEW
ncbi:MAG: hypothetical protein H7242_15135, partial [Microbacteriaceae bacterium]|nr:hypothetical protein [Burkholderiaceae bacterium]